MISPDISQNLVALEGQFANLTDRRAALHARIEAIEAALPDLYDLAGEVNTRLKAQESEVARLMIAAGPTLVHSGRDYDQRSVSWTDGNGTVQLSGPRPLDTVRGQLDRARRVYDALAAEAAPVRSSLITLQNERQEAQKAAGLLGGAIQGVEHQIIRMRAQEAERAALLGERLGWRDRLAAILRRLGLAGAEA